MIEIVDNFLPENLAVQFSRNFFNTYNWKPYWNTGVSKTESRSWNWHTSVGNDLPDMGQLTQDNSPEDMKLLWNATEIKLFELSGVEHVMNRWYSNSHTYGQEGPIHRDDGSFTCLYYPCENWQIDWEGGTAFYNEDITDVIQYAGYKFNRMVIFSAKIPHRAMPITRDCYRLRTSIVFKTSMDVNSKSYLDWYNKR